ncbi:DMT family transporter [Rothia nasisuis]|uniref:DMT family transporter n=1 Tax=Rothia nasisuis TaxID=2109647 RepID=UPI0034DEC786
MFAVPALMLAGALLPIQTTFNSRLRISVCSPYLASLMSFAGGTVFLAVLTWALNGSLLFPESAVAGQPGWIWVGGLLGLIGLTTNILVFPTSGGVQAVILPILLRWVPCCSLP